MGVAVAVGEGGCQSDPPPSPRAVVRATGFELLVHSRTRGVVMDIRNNNPVFGLDSLIQFKIIQAMHAAAPMTYAPLAYGLHRAGAVA